MSARINSLWMWEKKNRLRFDARMTALTLTLSVSLYLSVSLSHLRYRERLWANVLKKCLVKTTCSFLPFTVIGLEMNTTPIVPWRGDIAQWNSAGLVIWRSLVRPLAGTAGEISFPYYLSVLTLILVSVSPPFNALRSFYQKKKKKSGGGMLQLNSHTPLTWQCRGGLTKLSRHSRETHQGNELTYNSSANATCPQSSQIAEPLWTNCWLKEWNWCVQS